MKAGTCPLCDSTTHNYLFLRHGAPVIGCARCGLARLESPGERPLPATVAAPDPRLADACVAALIRRGASRSGMLAVVSDGGTLSAAAGAQGIAIASRRDVGSLEHEGLGATTVESAAVVLQLEHAANPVAALESIHRAMTPGGYLAIATPLLGVQPAHFYFDLQTLQAVCLRSGFAELEWPTDLHRGWPLILTARRVAVPPRPVLSVVMPVFNERATFQRTLDAVLAKEVPGIDKEVVIIESRSTDGTRELVQTYEGRPGVVVVYEDRPQGKGAAVRNGLRRATGTIVLIQDADDEYDVNDYDALLEPILTWQRAFVLGSRHMGSWKVRNFANQPAVSAFFNFGHVLFRTLFNLTFRQKIDDPFTMYKVFRRDCLHRLKFECNRFDFDFELVIKLVRKGYIPLEIPVNYTSRSFKDGKKVSAFRDPLTWIRALAKYRVASIYED